MGESSLNKTYNIDKIWLWDKIIILIIGISISLASICLSSNLFWRLLEIAFLIVVLFLSFPVWLIPLDMIVGTKSKYVYYSSFASEVDFEIFRKYLSVHLVFYEGKKRIELKLPIAITDAELIAFDSEAPKKNRRILICYYRFSKILRELEYVDNKK